MSDETEALIDKAGREKVFAYARALGWNANCAIPIWVWQNIANEILNEPQETPHDHK